MKVINLSKILYIECVGYSTIGEDKVGKTGVHRFTDNRSIVVYIVLKHHCISARLLYALLLLSEINTQNII